VSVTKQYNLAKGEVDLFDWKSNVTTWWKVTAAYHRLMTKLKSPAG